MLPITFRSTSQLRNNSFLSIQCRGTKSKAPRFPDGKAPGGKKLDAPDGAHWHKKKYMHRNESKINFFGYHSNTDPNLRKATMFINEFGGVVKWMKPTISSLTKSLMDPDFTLTKYFTDNVYQQYQLTSKKSAELVFKKFRDMLLAPPYWTYLAYYQYCSLMYDILGGVNSTETKSLRETLKVLETFNEKELSSNHRSVFSQKQIELIAEKTSMDVEVVERVLDEHDYLRADRRWYKLIIMRKKRLPTSMEDREYMATFDRPASESERKHYEKQRKEADDKFHERKCRVQLNNTEKRSKTNAIYYRTKGRGRWNLRKDRGIIINHKKVIPYPRISIAQ